MRLALIVTPSRAAGKATSELRDGDAIAARLTRSDAAFEVEKLDPLVDLAEQVESILAERALGPSDSVLVYAASPVVVTDDGELFLCLDPAEPTTGDALVDVVLATRERFSGSLAFILECRHLAGSEASVASADPFPSANVVAAAKQAAQMAGAGASLFATARPRDHSDEASLSPLTRELIVALDGASSSSGLTLHAFHAELQDSEVLLGAVAGFAWILGDPPFELMARRPAASDDLSVEVSIEDHDALDHDAAMGEAFDVDVAMDEAADLDVVVELEADNATPPAISTPIASGPVSRPIPSSPRSTPVDHVGFADARLEDCDLAGALSELKKALVLAGAGEPEERAGIYARMGEIKRKQDRPREAISNFEKALQLVPTHPRAQVALLELSVQTRDWRSVQVAEERVLASFDDRSERLARLVEFGSRWLAVAEDTARARACFERARELAPEDLTVLGHLRTLYEATRSGQEALAVRREIARLTPDPRERARLYFELGEVYRLELSREDLALELYNLALDSDPTQRMPLEIVARLLAERQEWSQLEQAYRAMLSRCASMPASHERREITWELHRRLGLLFRDHLEDPVFAIDAFEAALRVKPEDLAGRLTLVDLARLLHDHERAVDHLRMATKFEPSRGATYHELFHAFQRLGRPDEAYATASVTMFLGEPEQRERFIFEEHLPHGVPKFERTLVPDAWTLFLPEPDSHVESILTAVAPAAIAARIAELDRAGQLAVLDPAQQQDVKLSTVSAVRSFAWAGHFLGVRLPAVHLREDSPVTIASVIAKEPSVLVGTGALRGRSVPELAFLVGRHLAFEEGARRLLLYYPSLESLAACFLAAVKIVLPETALPETLQAAVDALVPAIEGRLDAGARRALVRAVTAFDQSGGRADLSAWVADAHRTVSRVGYLLAGDLQIAAGLIRSEPQSVLSAEEKMADLLSFAVSEAHSKLRLQLGVAIEP